MVVGGYIGDDVEDYAVWVLQRAGGYEGRWAGEGVGDEGAVLVVVVQGGLEEVAGQWAEDFGRHCQDGQWLAIVLCPVCTR